MDTALQVEPLVCKDEIWRLAAEAADKQQCIHESNPFPQGTQAHNTYQHYYWQRVRWLDGEESC